MTYPARLRNGRGLTLIEQAIAFATAAVMVATLVLTVMSPVSASENVVPTLDGAHAAPVAAISSAQHAPGAP